MAHNNLCDKHSFKVKLYLTHYYPILNLPQPKIYFFSLKINESEHSQVVFQNIQLHQNYIICQNLST